jgi:hypothetical protein
VGFSLRYRDLEKFMAERNLSVDHTTTWHCVQRVDFGLIKATRLTERANMEFRAEFFNLFNHANFGAPNVTMSLGNFGQVTSAADPRFIQFGLKLLF